MRFMPYMYCILCLLFIFTSCKNDIVKKENSNKLDSIKEGFTYKEVNLEDSNLVKITIPDTTIFVNKLTKGNLIYDVIVDTLNHYYISNRLVLFMASTDKNATDIDKIESTAQDGLLDSTNVDKFEFPFSVKFYQKGNNNLKIGIRDIIFLTPKNSLTEDIIKLESYTICNRSFYVKDSI